jgi:hypothetical protein
MCIIIEHFNLAHFNTHYDIKTETEICIFIKL